MKPVQKYFIRSTGSLGDSFKQTREKTVFTNGKVCEYVLKYLPKARLGRTGGISGRILQPVHSENVVV